MNISKNLLILSRKLEKTWQNIELNNKAPTIKKGWYVTEFKVRKTLKHIPELVIEVDDKKPIKRALIGFHTGRNRMLIYLPAGKLVAYDKAIEFDFLSKVSWFEGRLRVCLISFRYLLDFFSWPLVWHILVLQFKKPIYLSDEILQFYYPKRYDYDLIRLAQLLESFPLFRRLFERRYQSIKIAILLEDEAQKELIDRFALQPEAVLVSGIDRDIPKGIDYLLPLQKTEILHPGALGALKKFIKKQKGSKPDLIYSDHDYNPSSKMEAVFKPEPNLPYLYCYDYIGAAAIYSRQALADYSLTQMMSDEDRYYLNIKLMTDQIEKVKHIATPLLQSLRMTQMTTPPPLTEQTTWQNITWQRTGDYNQLLPTELPSTPAIDLMIPTRDGLSVLKPCIDSILERTSYPNYRIILIDNDSQLEETKRYLDELEQHPKIQVISSPGEFNYSAINNLAVAHSSADFFCLVNNDIEVISQNWLTNMMAWCMQEGVGAVGAKLLYSSGDIQHAGVMIGLGNAAGHIHRLEPGDSAGYQHRCVATQNMMAVTAACMLTPRTVFEQVSGLDEENLKIAYNDVDYCLKVDAIGKNIIWTPESVLYHHESVSRGDDMSEKHIKRYFKELGYFQKKWKTKGFVDRYYNKHLRISDEGVYPQLFASGDEQLHYLDEKSTG